MTIFGWDMSHFDAPSIGTAIEEGISFVTHKAGGDTAAGDPELAAWWAGIKDHRITEADLPELYATGGVVGKVAVGAYWVQYPGNPVGRADDFLATLDARCPGWRDGPFILQDDCEIWRGDLGTKPGLTDINRFCDRLVNKMPRLEPIVYAPEWAYRSSLAGLRYPLWASSYVGGAMGGFRGMYPGDGSSRWDAYSGQVPAVLQYTSSATIGGQTTCDADAFRGTLEELVALTAPGWSDKVIQADIDAIVAGVLGADIDPTGNRYSLGGALFTVLQRTGAITNTQLPALAAAAGVDHTDDAAIAAAVLAGLTPEVFAAAITAAGLTPEQIVAAIPEGLAEKVVDVLAARVQRPTA